MPDLEVTIIRLEPMRVACVHVVGEEPEHAAWVKMHDWAEPKGLLSDLEKHLMEELTVRRAMELAIEKELNLEKSLRQLADKISDPKVRDVFLLNAKSTHHHYELIESEYAHLMGMVHETDIDTYVRE